MRKGLDIIKKFTTFDKILILLVIFGVVLFGYTFLRKSTYITVTVKVGEDNVLWTHWSRSWFSQLFQNGMQEKDGLGRVNAQVKSVRSYDIWPSQKAVYLTIELKTVYSRSTDQYTYKGLAVLIGSPIKLYLDRVFVEGLVTHIDGVKDPREKKAIIAEAQLREESPTFSETSGIKQYLADALSIGQKIYDDQGNIIIEVLDIKVEDAKRLTTTSDGRTLVSVNPLRKDVYLKLKINAFSMQNRYYLFDDIPLLIGQTIPINTPMISVYPEITKIILP